jgi:hypothetical protein
MSVGADPPGVFYLLRDLVMTPWRLRAIAACIVTLVAPAAHAADLSMRVLSITDGKAAAVEVAGLPDELVSKLAQLPEDDPQFARYLSVYVKNADGSTQTQALAGRYKLAGNALSFTPRYTFVPGMKYSAEFLPRPDNPTDYPAQQFEFAIPAAAPTEPTKVTAVYPSAAVLPDNQLRFYIHFSAPMRLGEAYTHVKLLKSDGTADKRAFLEIGEELWDPSGQRLTMLFDPGRVKRGLLPREEFGPVLEAGKQYTLVIDKSWRDAQGRPLVGGHEKRFTAGPLIEAAINPADWKITPPAANTQEPFVIQFPRPLDRALLEWAITVEGPQQKPIAGDVSVADEERRWEFRPEQPWSAGRHHLVVDTTLEDTAGNNLQRPFEVDVFREVDKKPAPEYARVPFTIGGK